MVLRCECACQTVVFKGAHSALNDQSSGHINCNCTK